VSDTPPGPPPSWSPPGPPPSWSPPETSEPEKPEPETPQPAAAEGSSRLPIVLGLVAALVVLVAAVVVPRWVQGSDAEASTGTRTGVGIEGLQIYAGLRTDHTQDPVAYPQDPPVGGTHDPVWLACGAYDEPVRNENAVHDLEHGSVWISYRPGLSSDEVDDLADLLPQNGIMAPYPGLESPIVLTVWERQLAVDGPDDPRVQQFLTQLGAGETAPEAFVTCDGGTPAAGGEDVVQS
jgi:hypothetical protein